MKPFLPLLLFGLVMLSCNFSKLEKEADGKFSDQYFKTAISLVELYKIRTGQYPPALDSIPFMGDWDKMMFTFVEYEKLDTGYRLDVTGGFNKDSIPNLQYPKAFWQGLGIKKSNVLQTEK